MEDAAVFTRNPWTDDDRSLGYVKDVLFLAEKTGHIQKDHVMTEKMRQQTKQSSPSLKMMSQLKEIDASRKKIGRVNLDIQRRLQDKETQDITHTDVLEKRVKQINELNSHLQMIINQKDKLISRLQQPYVGDFIKMDVNYKKYASHLFPQVVPVLSDLSSHLDNIQWATEVDISDGHMESILSEISASLATFQSQFQSLTRLQQTTQNILTSSQLNVRY